MGTDDGRGNDLFCSEGEREKAEELIIFNNSGLVVSFNFWELRLHKMNL